MYIPNYYKNEDIEEVRKFIERHSFGILVNQVAGKLWATHIPLEISQDKNGKDVLHGHISRGNFQWKAFENNDSVLAIFSGAHTYISSSWYDHENVPTWNYIAVHVYGKIKIIEGEQLLNSLRKLVDKYEQSSEKPISVENMSKKYLEREMRGIVGFEIEIEEIQAKYKLSQNRDDTNHENIIKELEKRGDENSLIVAEEMRKHR
ncbi:MAG: FMN-binding negative transcriptional regulator [Thermoflexibacter sp.]|jgi:transcriptional regulator|nr:FMN-binding negative transcriptional regulator [Thermoflexibacter sp.]